MNWPDEHDFLITLDERIHPAHTAVLVVDVQNDYVSEGGASSKRNGNVDSGQAIIPPLKTLLDAARSVGTLVVYIQMTLDFPGRRLSSDVQYLRRRRRYGNEPMVVEGTWGHEVVEEVKPQEGDLKVTKQRSSSFVGTNLDLILRSNRIRSVLVTGVVTQGCVFATAQGALMHDYYVTVASDCVASSNRELHEAALMLLRNTLEFDDSVVESERILDVWEALASGTTPQDH